LLSLNFLSVSCTFWLTISSNISIKFSLITDRISSFRVFLRALLGSLSLFIFILLASGSGHLFSSFPSGSYTGGLPSRLELVSGCVGSLLVSLFNVAWGCYAQARGLEVSEFCLFLVVFPTRCISSVSPRVYFRKHAFCFLPLVTILESLI
jgi:hypothetical protein